MPVSACVEPGCAGFAKERGRCAEHLQERRQETRSVGRKLKIYGTRRWKATRRAVLSRDRYTCRSCKKFGNEVDHIVPLAQNGAPYAMSNLQTLCKACHSRKTALEVLHRV